MLPLYDLDRHQGSDQEVVVVIVAVSFIIVLGVLAYGIYVLGFLSDFPDPLVDLLAMM